MRSALDLVSLHDFRSYASAELRLGGRPAFLFGPNGAGKTNLLEAISLFSAGRGLRGASFSEVGRREAPGAPPRAWAVSARLVAGERELAIGTGSGEEPNGRRLIRIDGEPSSAAALAEWITPIWLTPREDRLFLDAAADRRRFFDRLVFAGEPGHARAVSLHDRAMRERMRLLIEGVADDAWLTALEARMAAAGAAAAAARARTLTALQGEIDARQGGAFPRARLDLTGEWERHAGAGLGEGEIGARLGAQLVAGRGRDAAAGRTLVGAHRGDLSVIHAGKDNPAAESSTGEQKALILNLVLAQAARLSRAKTAPNPILLLDEVAAHLDPSRRAALFDEIEALELQAFLTGTEEGLFEALEGRWLGVHVVASRLTVTET